MKKQTSATAAISTDEAIGEEDPVLEKPIGVIHTTTTQNDHDDFSSDQECSDDGNSTSIIKFKFTSL